MWGNFAFKRKISYSSPAPGNGTGLSLSFHWIWWHSETWKQQTPKPNLLATVVLFFVHNETSSKDFDTVLPGVMQLCIPWCKVCPQFILYNLQTRRMQQGEEMHLYIKKKGEGRQADQISSPSMVCNSDFFQVAGWRLLNSNQYLTWNSGDHLSLSLLVSQADIALEHLAFGPGWGFGPGCAWTWVGTVCSSSV